MLPLLAGLLPGPIENVRQSIGDPLFFWVLESTSARFSGKKVASGGPVPAGAPAKREGD